VVAWLPPSGSGSAPAPRVRWTLLALGAGEYLVATVLARRKRSAGASAALERVRRGFLIRFAAAEAIAVFGLMLHFLAAPAGWVLAFFGTSITAFLFAYPSRKAFEEGENLLS
jgi:ABC-type antimicrobial peptide transport system permease subunit